MNDIPKRKQQSYSIDRTRWQQRSIFEQLGNIGSEVGRSFIAKRNGRPDDMQAALARALDLFDATVEGLVDVQQARAREVLRAKEQYIDVLTSPDSSRQAEDAIENYFMQFALTARLQR